MLSPVLVTPASSGPITLAQVKSIVHIDHADEDDSIELMIDAAIALVDGYGGILRTALIEQTWQQDFPYFPYCEFRLALGQLLSVTSITYYDTSNVQQTLATSVYAAFSDATGPFFRLKDGQSWPSTFYRDDAVRVTWKAGFGTTADFVPADIRHAMLMLIGHWFENRETSVIGEIPADLQWSFGALTKRYSRVGF